MAISLATLTSNNMNNTNWVLGGKDIVIEVVKLFNFDKRSDEITYFPLRGKYNSGGNSQGKLIYRTYEGYRYAIVALPNESYGLKYFAVVAAMELPETFSPFIPTALLIVGFILLFAQGIIGAVSASKKSWITSNGTATNVYWHEEKPAINIPFLVQASYLLTFKVEETDNAGNISKNTTVEFILKQRRNLIENGEQVNVSGKMTKNNILSGRRLLNIDTNAEITAKGSGSNTKYYLTLLIPLSTTIGVGFLNWYFFINPSRFESLIISIFTPTLNRLDAVWNGAWLGCWIGLFIAAVLMVIMLIFVQYRIN